MCASMCFINITISTTTTSEEGCRVDMYEIILNNNYVDQIDSMNSKRNPVIVYADSISVGGDRWVKFYTVDNASDQPAQGTKMRTNLVYTVIDEYVMSVRNLGVAPPESQPPPNEDALDADREISLAGSSAGTSTATGSLVRDRAESATSASTFELEHEPPVGTVLRLSYEASTPGGFTEMVLTRTRLNDGWMSSTDGHIFPWKRVHLMLQEVARVEIAEFRTVFPVDGLGYSISK